MARKLFYSFYFRQYKAMAFLREPYPEDIANRIAHDFTVDDRASVTKILNEVRDLGWHVPWVQLAILRAADGKLHHLRQWVDLGNKDPQDLQLSLESFAGPSWEREFILYHLRGSTA
jgi:hypothetical protein